MADRQRGFDPLASLFEAPDPGAADGQGEDAPGPPEAAQAPAAASPEPASLPADVAAEPPAAVDKAAIAKAVAQAAAARLQAAQPSAPRPPRPKPGPSEADKAALARQLAQQAAQRIAAQKEAAAPSSSPAAPKGSRLDRIARRSVRPKNALEAARQAAQAEAIQSEEAAKAHAAARKQQLSERVQVLLPKWLPGVGRLQVERAIFADQRAALLPLWAQHRARFLEQGELERGAGAAAVLHALQTVDIGRLVAAFIVTDASDYLVWMDIDLETGKGNLLAAFANARSYFAGG